MQFWRELTAEGNLWFDRLIQILGFAVEWFLHSVEYNGKTLHTDFPLT